MTMMYYFICSLIQLSRRETKYGEISYSDKDELDIAAQR